MTNETIHTPYGVFSGVTAVEHFPSGQVSAVRLGEKNVLITHAGDLVPFFGEDTPRRKYKASVAFHLNGMVRAVSLQEQQAVMTPIGELPAELVTFYETGELKSVFPLDGKISGFWSEEDECALLIPLSFDFDFASFTARLSGLSFYKSGQIRSLTLFPGEQIEVRAGDCGKVSVRHGFSLFESGELESLEPAVPVRVDTPVGAVHAFDAAAVGVNAASNSLRLDTGGRIVSLVTGDRLFVRREADGLLFTFHTEECRNDEGEVLTLIPLRLDFHYEDRSAVVSGGGGVSERFSFGDDFIVAGGMPQGCSPEACANCSLCGEKN
jgi:hypothetical protein